MEKKIQFQYLYLKIVENQFATFEENYAPNIAVQVNNSITFGFSFDNNVLQCSEEISYVQGDKIVLKICVSSHFIINKESAMDFFTNNSFVCPRPILCQFASLNYGCMRGIIYEKTKGTVLNEIILPPYYFDEMIKDDIQFFPKK